MIFFPQKHPTKQRKLRQDFSHNGQKKLNQKIRFRIESRKTSRGFLLKKEAATSIKRHSTSDTFEIKCKKSFLSKL